MDSLKNWTMIVLTLIFALFYTTALLGWLKPLSDMTSVIRLEPILFVIIGYYFASSSAQKAEAVLRREILRCTSRTDTARQDYEQTRKERYVLEEKLRNVRTILMAVAGKSSSKTLIERRFKTDKEENREALWYSINTAINILNS